MLLKSREGGSLFKAAHLAPKANITSFKCATTHFFF